MLLLRRAGSSMTFSGSKLHSPGGLPITASPTIRTRRSRQSSATSPGLAGNANDFEGTHPFPDPQVVVNVGSLPAGMRGILGVNRSGGAEPVPHQVGCAGMIAVGDNDMRDAQTHEVIEGGVAGLHGIDADVSIRMAQQVAVEVVALTFRIPGPSENARNDLFHRVFPPTLQTPEATPTSQAAARSSRYAATASPAPPGRVGLIVEDRKSICIAYLIKGRSDA
jgi:hypothetical protein